MSDDVDHRQLMEKLVEHEGKFVKLGVDIHGINEKLKPISAGIDSIAWGFRAILWGGAISAAVVGILELAERI